MIEQIYHASGHTLYARLRTLGGLMLLTRGFFPFVVHMACNNMDATYLSGNEWIIYLNAMVSNVCSSFVVHTA